MFSVMFVLYERDGIDRGEALAHWKDRHGPLVSKVPGVRRYVQSHAVAAPQGDPPYLGIAVLEFDDEAAYNAAQASPEMAEAVADAANFADPDRVDAAFVEHVTIVD